jgi:PAS domain S-box-containing protein
MRKLRKERVTEQAPGRGHERAHPSPDEAVVLRALLDSAADLLMVVGEDGTIRFAAGAGGNDMGIRPCALVGTTIETLALPADALKVRGFLADCLSDTTAQITEFRLGRGRGLARAWVEARGRNLLADPALAGVVVALSEITKRKWAEEALRAAEAKYRTLVEQLPLVTYIDRLDDASSSVYMSPQIEALVGYSAQEWLSDPALFTKLLHPDDRDRVLAEVARTNATGEPFRCEYRLVARDGRIVRCRDEAVTVHDEDGRPLFAQGYLLDVTIENEGGF